MSDDKSSVASDLWQSNFSGFDDLTNLSEEYRGMSSSGSNVHYNQVTFHNLMDVYPSDSDIRCSYSLSNSLKPHAGDKIALFKVGWVSVSDFITFVRPDILGTSGKLQQEVVFKAGTMPIKENEQYQLCYITNGNAFISGASTPFSFQKPHESEYVAVEDPTDPDLVVFRSRVTQLQNELEKENEERETFMTKYHLLEERFNILNKEFIKCENELMTSKEQISQLLMKQTELTDAKAELENCLSKCNAEISSNENLKLNFQRLIEEKQEIIDGLQQQINTLTNEAKQNEIQLKEMLLKYNQLEKSYTECQNELTNSKDELSALRIQQSEAEKNIVGGVDKLDVEMYEKTKSDLEKYKLMYESLQQEKERRESGFSLESIGNDESLTMLKSELESLSTKNKELEEDNQMVKAQFENLEIHHSKCDLKAEAKLNALREEFEQERHGYLEQIEQLEKTKSSANDVDKEKSSNEPPRSQMYGVLSNLLENGIFSKAKQQDTTVVDGHKIVAEDDALEMKGKFSTLLQKKIELSETLVQERHRIQEFEKMTLQSKEENAALKSRINVLEFELATLMKNRDTNSLPDVDLPSTSQSLISEQLALLNKNLPTLNNYVADYRKLEQKLKEEADTKLMLQSKVQFLLQEDNKLTKKIQEMAENYEKLDRERNELAKSLTQENIDILRKALDENDIVIASLKEKLADNEHVVVEKEKLEMTINELRKELVGKISLGELSKLKTRLADLEAELGKKASDCKYLAKFIQDRYKTGSVTKALPCPLCAYEFPASAREAFANHFESHLS